MRWHLLRNYADCLISFLIQQRYNTKTSDSGLNLDGEIKARRAFVIFLFFVAIVAITIYHKLGGLSDKNLFLTVLEAGSPRSRCQLVWFLQRPLSCTCRWPPSHYVLILPFLCVQAFLVSLCLLIRTPVILDWGPTLWSRLTLTTSLKVLSPNTVTLGVRASTCAFGRI